jgi:DNA-binding IscR family transcriptional regulator
MKLRRTTFHALDAAIHLARFPLGTFLSSGELAKILDQHPTYTRNLLAGLTREGVLQGRKRRGYRLARPANKITLLQIIEAASGPIDNGCQLKNKVLAAVLVSVAAGERKAMSSVTLADLL